MAQFDVYINPIENERPLYPYVVQLSSDFLSATQARLTAPLSPQALTPVIKGVHPALNFDNQVYVLEIMSLVSHHVSDLRVHKGHLRDQASLIFSALDFAFHGY